VTLANEQGKYYKCRLMRRHRADSGLRRADLLAAMVARRYKCGNAKRLCCFALDGANEMLVRLYSREIAATTGVIYTSTNDAQCRL